jgi:glycosyltransferase involved in cell wall biosynthesis
MSEMNDLDRPSNGPLVTVVTPSFNQGRFIRDTIESVLSQDYPNLEYMVIDGGSTDETVSILESYRNRFFWVSEPDRGQAHAINKGWRRAKGDILAWLNSDDMYLPGAISNAVRYLMDHTETSLVYGDGYHVAEDGRMLNFYPTEPFDPHRLVETCFICQPATFMRRAVVENLGFLDESLHFCMDYDLWIRVSRQSILSYMPLPFAKSRFYGTTKTLRDRPTVYKETMDMLYRHYGFVPSSWACGHAFRLLQTRVGHSGVWRKFAFVAGMLGVCVWNFARYNYHMPPSELRRWFRGFREGVRKLIHAERLS